MGKGSGSVSPPPVAPPAAIPDKSPEAAEFARRKIPRGRQDTFLTGNLVPDTGKKKRFG